MNRLLWVWLSMTLLGPLGAQAASEKDSHYDWVRVPEEARSNPHAPTSSEYFSLIDSTSDSLVIAFKGPDHPEESTPRGEEFQAVIAVPPGGVSSSDIQLGQVVYLKEGRPVIPETTVEESANDPRFTVGEMGEFRGARLIKVSYRPSLPARKTREVDRFWVRDATLTVRLAEAFTPPREISPLWQEAFEAVLLNPEHLAACLPAPLDSTSSANLERWRGEALKIRTRDTGWHFIPGDMVVEKWGANLDLSQVSLISRGRFFSPPRNYRVRPVFTSDSDREKTLFLLDKNGRLKETGPIAPDDRLVFEGEVSTQPYDSENCYWLVREAASPPPRTPATAPASVVHATALLEEVQGEDREFLYGGHKTEDQEYFWVDRPFPEGATATLDLRLPEWVQEKEGALGYLRVLFKSADFKKHTPPAPLRQAYLRVRCGTQTLSVQVRESLGGFGWEVAIPLPAKIESPTLSINYHSSKPPRAQLYFDSLRVVASQPLVWEGTPVAYSFAEPVVGQFVFSASEEGIPRTLLGKTSEGVWVPLEAEERAGGFAVASSHRLTRIDLFDRLDPWPATGLEWRALPGWVEEPIRAEEMILSPPVFREGCEEIARIHALSGVTAQWIDLEQVYDVFSGGQFSPFALRDFLNWVVLAGTDVQPSSVLLVGDSRWDAWGRFPHSHLIPRWTPSYHVDRDPDYPSDLWFVEGEKGDWVADWMWGRLPCQREDQLEGYLHKLRGNLMARDETWSRRLLWVTDDNDPVGQLTEEIFEKTLPLELPLKHLQIRDYPFVDNFYYGRHLPRIQEEARTQSRPLDFGKISPEANQALREEINSGVALFIYYGHSGPNVLAHERVLFGGGSIHSDVPTLANGPRAPFAMFMTCDVGRFDFCEIPKWSISLSEEILFHPEGGLLGLIVSTGKGIPSDHQPFLVGAVDAMYNRGISRIGMVHWVARLHSLTVNGGNPALDMFTLMGDPLFELPFDRLDLPARIERLRWSPEGILEFEVTLDPEVGKEKKRGEEFRVEAWQLDEELRVDWSWPPTPVDASGTVRFILPDARDLEGLRIGIEASAVSSEGGSRHLGNAALAVDLPALPGRPDWAGGVEEGSPNLVVTPEDVVFLNPVMEGQTAFVQVHVRNQGESVARDVEIVGRTGDGEVPIPTFADYPAEIIPFLAPGEERSVRLRWDRWQEQGEQKLVVLVDPDNEIAERDESDNRAEAILEIRTKPDLAWGFVAEATEPVRLEEAIPAPAGWVLHPTTENLLFWDPLAGELARADRAAQVAVPLTNFGETPSATCSLLYHYWADSATEVPSATVSIRIGPVHPTGEQGVFTGKRVPLLLIPGLDRITVEADPLKLVDEVSTENNRLDVKIPPTFWERFPPLE